MSENPSFSEFTWATTGRKPFPWQENLASRVISDGWPDEIGVPTGLGKTACIDIAIWALAAEAEADPADRRHPSRIWYVVNRRLLVDEGADRAIRLARMLDEPDGADIAALASTEAWNDPERQRATGIVGAVADRLRKRTSLGQAAGPLHVGRFRGGVDLGQLPSSPAQPAVLLATAPMFGSRLLFRGYGSSRYTRSLDAAYASTDALVLLDEAHLSQQLSNAVSQLAEADDAPIKLLPTSRADAKLVALTATGGGTGDRFDLGPSDLANPIVSQRINAAKPTRLVATTKSGRATALAQAVAGEFQGRGQPAAAVIFSNTAALVPKLFKSVVKATKGLVSEDDVIVLTGRLRGDHASEVRDALLAGPTSLRSGRDRAKLPAHRIVIATQTLEVGADLDFDILVTESAGVRALTQRLGRLNRLGEASGPTPAVIVHAKDQKSDPVYGDEPAAVWERLNSAEVLDLRPSNTQLLGQPADHGARSPELLPNHLDEYVKTTDPPVGEAPVDLFINGIEEQSSARLNVAWRCHLPMPITSTTNSGAEALDMALVPGLRSDETVEVPIGELRDLVKRRDLESVRRLKGDRIHFEACRVEDLRPGDQVILEVGDGGYDRRIGWDPTSLRPVADLSAVLDTGRVTDALLLEPTAVASTLARLDVSSITADAIVHAAIMLHAYDGHHARTWREELTKKLDDSGAPPAAQDKDEIDAWQERFNRLADDIDELDPASLPDGRGPIVPDAELVARVVDWIGESDLLDSDLRGSQRLIERNDGLAWCVRKKPDRRQRWASPAADAYDELSLADRSISLTGHLRSTGDVAERFARDVGLPDPLVLAVGNAGRLHDLGKIEPRFQAWLGATADTPAAKSGKNPGGWLAMQQLSGWPSGGRHELLSVRVAQAAWNDPMIQELLQPDPSLVLHLVASHHGRGRPGLFGVARDDGGAEFEVDLGALLKPGHDSSVEQRRVISGDLAVHDLEQPVRFQEVNSEYGRRGVALLECIVRQADWAASAAAESEEPAV